MTDDSTDHIADEEVAVATPLDPDRRLRGPQGSGLVEHVLDLMAAQETRHRALRGPALELRKLTVEVLLANLAASSLHSINPRRPVAVSFHKNRYPMLGLSHSAMTLARDTLDASGLISHRHGYYERPVGKDLRECRRAARLRAPAPLRRLFDDFGVGRRAIYSKPSQLIRINRPEDGAGDVPANVAASETTLARINDRIADADLVIPCAVWNRLRTRPDAAGEDPTRFYQGDQTAKALRRVFTYNWHKGGRLYGGWWQGLTASDRKLLTIDGLETVEIDFRNLHPLLLYRALGEALDIDPYALPPYPRELCKETFQRLLNRTPEAGGAAIKRPKEHSPPPGVSFTQFLGDYTRHLAPVAKHFGTGLGLTLQYLDSNLILEILDKLDAAGIAAFPVHDSLIVQAKHGEATASAMRNVFATTYGAEPELHFSR